MDILITTLIIPVKDFKDPIYKARLQYKYGAIVKVEIQDEFAYVTFERPNSAFLWTLQMLQSFLLPYRV